ncbi:MAG TPA: hypothetical protein ENJ18_05230 [Nannocystis exedens]|nr:hypothetical protein [Nannocystis exedens]
MQTYPDEYIEWWAERYEDLRLLDRGILFEYFLLEPENILAALGLRVQRELPEKLLPQQEKVMSAIVESDYALQRELDDNAQIVCRNGRYTEPLHHHAHPRRGRAFHGGHNS